MYQLKAFKVLLETKRISSVDVFRSIAILAVVLHHFHWLPYGFLGVDLFFLISGLLVGGLLTNEFKIGNDINYFKFFLQRGFKIWPSYYAFLLLGNILAFFLFRIIKADQIIPLWDFKRYLFFYQNFTGPPFHWVFDHIWSLCVEEHFYVLLPIMFLFLQKCIPEKHKIKALFVMIVLTIIAGIFFKYLAYTYTKSKDTYSATYNRIDALAWGVLLNFIITFFGKKIKSFKFSYIISFVGIIVFWLALYFSIKFDNGLYEKVYFHSIIPFSFFLILLGFYFIDLSGLKIFRFISYYSYNWYLWHPIFVVLISYYIGNGIIGLTIYLILSFIIAVIATIFIEEPFLEVRKKILG